MSRIAARGMKKPTTADDWIMLEFEISSLFDGAPIDEEDLFAGRSAEVTKMLRSVMERAKHVVLFGERGVGKTSLSKFFGSGSTRPSEASSLPEFRRDHTTTFLPYGYALLKNSRHLASLVAGRNMFSSTQTMIA